MNQAQLRAANIERDLKIAVSLTELWRLCAKSSCRRSRECRGDARLCAEHVADWHDCLQRRDKSITLSDAIAREREKARQNA
jgi:hypothetical protein